jgi:hypothetical protein
MLAGCASSADCAEGEMCEFAPQHACGLDGTRGLCIAGGPRFCPSLAFWVCGCDGNRYFNECLADAHHVDIAYGGPCRPATAPVACTTDADCPTDDTFQQFCVDDPSDECDPTAGDTGCAGVCVHAQQPCDDSGCLPTGALAASNSPDTQACIALLDAGSDAQPGVCVYTSRLRCATASDCNAGELCLPPLGCGAGTICLGWCALP